MGIVRAAYMSQSCRPARRSSSPAELLTVRQFQRVALLAILTLKMRAETSAARSSTSRGSDPESHRLLTVKEAAAFLRIGRNTCYELIRQGQLPHVRLGRLIRVPRLGLESWIARQAGLQAEGSAVISFPSQRH